MSRISKTIEFFERLSPTKSRRKPAMGNKSSKNNEDFGVYKANHDFKPETGSSCLFLIDPQNDFIIDGGTLQVEGAIEDSKRTASFIMKNIDNFGNIYVSLDTHMQFHIAHKSFWFKLTLPANEEDKYDWSKAKKTLPSNFDAIPHQSLKTFVKREDQDTGETFAVRYVTQKKEMQPWAEYYTEKLEKGSEKDGIPGTLTLTVWPDHCLIGSHGHNVQEDIFQALQAWERATQRSVTYVLKGTNSKTEHYSALKAEVIVLGDSKTKFNTNLYKSLVKHSKIYVAGQARSHCVNFTTRHLVMQMKKEKMKTSKIHVVKGSMSDVIGCAAIGNVFFSDMEKAGLKFLDISDIKQVEGDWKNKSKEELCDEIDNKYDISIAHKTSKKRAKSKTKSVKSAKIKKVAEEVTEEKMVEKPLKEKDAGKLSKEIDAAKTA